MARSSRHSREVRERAVALMLETQSEYDAAERFRRAGVPCPALPAHGDTPSGEHRDRYAHPHPAPLRPRRGFTHVEVLPIDHDFCASTAFAGATHRVFDQPSARCIQRSCRDRSSGGSGKRVVFD